MNKPAPVLEGERVRLEPIEPRHAAPLFEVAQHPEIWPYLPLKVERPEDMAAFVDDALRAGERGDRPFAVYDKSSERYVGSTRLHDYDPGHRGLEIGWTWYTPEVWRTSVNTECKYLLLTYAFEQLGLIRVQLKTDERNTRSQQAIARLGAVREGVLRKHRVLSDGFIRNSVYYSILDDEWPNVKARLEGFLQRRY